MPTVKTRYGSGRPTNYQRAIAGYLNEIASEMIEFLVINKKVASGTAVNSFEVDVKGARTAAERAQLLAVNYINFALGGRDAGGMPPVDKIAQWIAIKGLDLDPWTVAKTIAALGTNDPHFREAELQTAMDLAWIRWGDRLALGWAEITTEILIKSFTSKGYKVKK